MKKIIFSLLCIGTFQIMNAQLLIANPNDSAEVSTAPTDGFMPNEAHIHLINNAGYATTVHWKHVSHVAPATWEVKLCDNNNCYDLLLGGNTTFNSLSIPAGDSMDMKAQLTAHCVDSTGTLVAMAWIPGADSAASVTYLTYTMHVTNACPSALNENTASASFSLMPNPVNNQLQISGLQANVLSLIEVLDITGNVVMKSETTGNENLALEVSKLAAGNYFLKLTENGITGGMKRFLKN